MTAYELRHHLAARHGVLDAYLRGSDYATLTAIHDDEHNARPAGHDHGADE